MSIYKVNPGDVSSFIVVTNPIRTYTSSSTQGVTGSVYVYPRRSSIEKDTSMPSSFVDMTHDDSDVNSLLNALQKMGRYAYCTGSVSASFSSMVTAYLNKVNSLNMSNRKLQAMDVVRFTPSVTFTSNTLRKLVIKDTISPYYRVTSPSAHWAFTNYNCLSFFTASTVPETSVLLYPSCGNSDPHAGYVAGTYVPSGAFGFDFYINPRYRSGVESIDFKDGTIFHLPSVYALSLISGTLRDHNGLIDGFRLKLQLSHSADVEPSKVAVAGAYPNNLVFLSDDNSLRYNRWHHVVVRWGTSTVNGGTGSFNVDGIDKGTFLVPSATIAPLVTSVVETDVLCVGNFFSGTYITNYFARDPALRDGLIELDGTPGVEEPPIGSGSFTQPLNADLHDLCIKRYYMSDYDVEVSASRGMSYVDRDRVAFYVPPFFVESSSFRQYVGDHGGVPQTPFFEIDGSTNDPFSSALSFGVDGHYVNVENYVKDFANDTFPRLHHMTATILSNTTTLRTANEFLYDQPFVVRRNFLVMPCDDGAFVPEFTLLTSESIRISAVDDLGVQELSFVHVGSMLSTSSLLFNNDFDEDSTIPDELIGFTPERPGVAPGNAFNNFVENVDDDVLNGVYDPGVQRGAPLSIYQRTRDDSSNQVTFFDVSNLFYGKRILPGSVVLKDTLFTGSGGAVSITLKDNKYGTLYRADCLTSASTWSSVGTVFYNEGVIVIKSPHLYFFGKEGYELSFKGEQNVHVMQLNVLAPVNQLNSSSNPTYQVLSPSSYANDPDGEFVYITAVNFHDDNMNVVMKSQLAQPITKRPSSRVNFKIKHDW